MSNTWVIALVSALLSSGGIGALLTYLNGRTQAGIARAQSSADSNEKSYARLERENTRLSQRVQTLEDELDAARKIAEDNRTRAVQLQMRVDEMELTVSRVQREAAVIREELALLTGKPAPNGKETKRNGA